MVMAVDRDDIYWQIGLRIRRAREGHGITQDALATWADLTRASIANIEAGRQRVTIHALFKMAGGLNVSMSELLPDYAAEPHFDVEELVENGVQRKDAEKIARLLR